MSTQTSRATVLQGVQVAKETVPGFGDAPTKRIKNLTITFSPNIPVTPVRYPGSKAATDTQLSKEMTELAISGVPDFNNLPLMFDCMYGTATPSSPGSAAARLRAYNPAVVAALAHPATLSIETGSSKGAEKITYGVVSGITLRGSKTETSLEGSGFGQVQQESVAYTSGVSVLAPSSAHQKNVALFWSLDGTNYTRLTDVMNWEVKLAGLWEPTFHVDDEEPSYDEIHEKDPDYGAKIGFEKGSESADMLGRLRASTMGYLGVRIMGGIIEAGTGIADPTKAANCTAIPTGGTLAAGTHYIKYSYVNGAGQTLLSPATVVVTTGSTSRIAVQVPMLPLNATRIRVHYSSDNVTYTAHGTSAVGSGNYIVPNSTVSGAAPSTNSSGTPPIYEQIRINLPVLVTQQSNGDIDGLYGSTYDFINADDETFGLAQITVTNGIASY